MGWGVYPTCSPSAPVIPVQDIVQISETKRGRRKWAIGREEEGHTDRV